MTHHGAARIWRRAHRKHRHELCIIKATHRGAARIWRRAHHRPRHESRRWRRHWDIIEPAGRSEPRPGRSGLGPDDQERGCGASCAVLRSPDQGIETRVQWGSFRRGVGRETRPDLGLDNIVPRSRSCSRHLGTKVSVYETLETS